MPPTCIASFATLASKPVPLIVSVAPTAGVEGKTDVIESGVGVTEKVEALTAVPPATVTDRRPVDAPVGTGKTSEVAVAVETVALTPLILTASLVLVVLKLVPVIVIAVPTGPLRGEKLVMVGGRATVKVAELVTVTPFTATEIFPVVAPDGTVVVIDVAVADATTAMVPLNLTVSFAAVVLKFVPLMVTCAPTTPV